MSIHHHLDDATILAYAAGTLGEAMSVVAASHAAWCPQCRKAIRQAEAVGGGLMTTIEGTSVSADCRERTLAALSGATLHRFPAAPKPVMAISDMPLPLARLLGGSSLDDIKWRTKVPGIALFDIALPGQAQGQLRLMRIAPGKSMPQHGHGGEEMTMILSGAYHDKLGRFARGDVADLDDDIEHQPIVDKDEPCICLVATEAPTRFKSVIARLLQPIVGI